MRIWLGLLLKIMVWTKSYIPQNCTISQNNQIHESNYDSFQGLTPVVPGMHRQLVAVMAAARMAIFVIGCP
jgi:hypothetical protein